MPCSEKTTTNDETFWRRLGKLGGVLAANSAPAATSSGGVINVFVHGTDNALWYETDPIMGPPGRRGTPSAVFWLLVHPPPRRCHRVLVRRTSSCRGTDNALWSKTTTNGGTTLRAAEKLLGGVLAADS